MGQSLPYKERALLFEQDGTEVAQLVPLTIWPAGRRSTDRGEYYDYEAEAPLRLSNQLRVVNRYLELAGERYVIVEATIHSVIPHVALRLRRHNA